MAREREDGLAALQKGDLPTAAILLEQVVRQDKQDFESHLYLGGVYHQMKRHGDAARVLTRATELQPDSAQARFNLGIAQEQGGDLIGAQASFQQAILLQAEYPVAHEALERVEARLNGPSLAEEARLASEPGLTIAPNTAVKLDNVPPTSGNSEASVDASPAGDKPVFARPVNSSFGKAAPAFVAPPDSPPTTSNYTPTSSATPVFPSDYAAGSTGGAPASSASAGAAGADTPSPGASEYAPTMQPNDMPPPPNPYAPGYGANPYAPPPPGYGPPPPGYGPGYAPPRSVQGQAPYGQPPYGQPPIPGQPPPYGQPPYGAGYAPPGAYGYGGAQQYVVTQPVVPQEATVALILAILGLPLGCTGLGIVFSPISLYLALKARRMMQADPRLGGQGTATAALWLAGIGIGLNVLALIAIIIAMLTGS